MSKEINGSRWITISIKYEWDSQRGKVRMGHTDPYEAAILYFGPFVFIAIFGHAHIRRASCKVCVF